MSQAWTLGAPEVVPPPRPALPIYKYTPDGHISFFPHGQGSKMIWAGSTSYASTGPDLMQMEGAHPVLSPGAPGSFDNGGAWLYNVFPSMGPDWLGFYHAEDHEFSADPSSTFVAWKSIALVNSQDGGRTWIKGQQIITSSKTKPDKPKWGGNGDFCVVRDEKKQRWVCFYQDHFLSMSSSTDPLARSGTWKKWYKGSFSEPGLGGRNAPIAGLASHPGGNPSVHWNTFLQKWVMVWHTWSGSGLFISTSDDLETWAAPQLLLASEKGEKLWYPTILADTDLQAGREALLCYARFPNAAAHERVFEVRRIQFSLSARPSGPRPSGQ